MSSSFEERDVVRRLESSLLLFGLTAFELLSDIAIDTVGQILERPVSRRAPKQHPSSKAQGRSPGFFEGSSQRVDASSLAPSSVFHRAFLFTVRGHGADPPPATTPTRRAARSADARSCLLLRLYRLSAACIAQPHGRSEWSQPKQVAPASLHTPAQEKKPRDRLRSPETREAISPGFPWRIKKTPSIHFKTRALRLTKPRAPFTTATSHQVPEYVSHLPS